MVRNSRICQTLITCIVFWRNQVQMVPSGRKVAGAVRPLVNLSYFQLECIKVLDEALLMPVLLYGSEIVVWREKEISRIGPV